MATLNGSSVRKRIGEARTSAARVRATVGGSVQMGTLWRLLLAIALAFGLWVYVTIRSNPDATQTLPSRSVAVRGLADGLVMTTGLPQVDINIIGPEILVETATRSVTPYVDLSEIGPGKGQRVKINAERPSGLRIVWINPAEVVVDIEQKVTRDYTLQAEMPAPFDVQVDSPTIEPAAVTIAGPQSTIDQIVRVVVRPDFNQLTGQSGLVQTVRPVPLDRLGREVIGPWMEIDPTMVQVTLPAREVTGAKAVSIKPVIIGQPANGYRLESISTTPSIVTVRGEASQLQGVTALETETIDISGRQQSQAQTVKLKAPAGLVIEPTTVQIDIGITPIEARTKLTLVAVARGLGPGLRAQIVPGSVDVTLQGAVPGIQSLDVGAMRAEVNLQGLGPGTHQVKPSIAGLGDLRVDELQPEMVTVQIAAEPTPTPRPAPPTTPTS